MILVDLGNSRCKIALMRKGELELCMTEVYPDTEDLQRAPWVAEKISQYHKDAQPVRWVSVLGKEFSQELRIQLQQRDITDLDCLTAKNTAGIELAYAQANDLGTDRVAAMLGAMSCAHQDVIVVDGGTAITIDAMRASGRHLGGLILPGRMNMYSMIGNNTRQLPKVLESPLSYFARSTTQCMYSGASLSLIHGVEGIVRKMLEVMPDAMVWLTGGDAQWLSEHLTLKTIVDEMLVLRGLYEVFRP